MAVGAAGARRAIVLVVEDEPVLRASTVRGLGRLRGVDVVDAATVAEARRLIEAMPPHLVVSDLNLPDGTGVEIIGHLDKLGLRVPVIFVSAYVRSYRARLPTRSNIDVREKPVPIEELRALVERWLEVRAAEEEEDAPFSLSDYLQLACIGRHSIVLSLESGGTAFGTVAVSAGELWTAHDSQGTGEAAFRRLFAAASRRRLSTRCTTLHGDPGPRTIDTPWQHALLEAARIFDEAVAVGENPEALPAGGASAPSLHTGPAADAEFSAHVEEGVDALLRKDYDAAYAAFLAAAALRPDDARVRGNLSRLEALGHGRTHAGAEGASSQTDGKGRQA